MPTVLAREVIADANTLLVDAGFSRWSEQELLGHLNAAQLAIALRRPDSSVVNETLTCVAGTKQELPATGLRVIKIVRNTVGKTAVTFITQDVLDEQLPDWHDETVHVPGTVEHYVFDDRDPRTYYTYPPAADGHQLDGVYSVAPATVEETDFTNGTETITLPDIYRGPILDYILWRCYLKDSENATNAARAANHYNAFLRALGDKTQADAAVSPANDST
ncbi:MAG: DUF6682 family protein [Pseudomonadota bacterium]